VADDDRIAGVLAAAQAGDGRACTTLFESLGRPVAGFLRGRGVDDPDGAANEVFVRVFTRLRHFDGDEANFRSWVFAIARNLAADEHRARARRAACVAIDEHVASLASTQLLPEAAVLATEGVDALLASLSTDQRDVVLLRFVADLSIEETARTLDKEVTAVKALQHRALDALRRELERQSTTSTAGVRYADSTGAKWSTSPVHSSARI
jgi:RNA polymerase sigma-70 factor (ECF subfamily)